MHKITSNTMTMRNTPRRSNPFHNYTVISQLSTQVVFNLVFLRAPSGSTHLEWVVKWVGLGTSNLASKKYLQGFVLFAYASGLYFIIKIGFSAKNSLQVC